MIPRIHITGWQKNAPWPLDEQVEQDLVICRATVEIFSHPLIFSTMAFRGGTALHKLHFDRPGRYSEDIDLVQVVAGPIGPGIAAIRERLDPWLGPAKSKRTDFGVTLKYWFNTETQPASRKRLKVDINTREHFDILGLESIPLTVDSGWYRGTVEIRSLCANVA